MGDEDVVHLDSKILYVMCPFSGKTWLLPTEKKCGHMSKILGSIGLSQE